jgi:hypothetical protein
VGYEFVIDAPSSGNTQPRRLVPRPAPLQSFTEPVGTPSPFGRIDFTPAIMKGVELAAKAPGYIYDRPLAAINQIGNVSGKGPIDQTGDFIRGIPGVGDLLSGVAQGVGNTLSGLQRITKAPINAGMMNALTATNHMAPTDKVDGLTAWLSGAGGLFGDLTVAQLRETAKRRGFSDEDVRSVLSGQRSAFDWADKSLSDNPIVDVAGQIVTDPTTYLAFGGAARLAGGVSKLLPDALVHMTRLDRLATGMEAIGRAVDISRVPFKSTLQGMAALRAGSIEGVQLGTLARHLALFSRGSSDFLRAYRKVAIGTTAAQLGVQELSNTGYLDNTPLSPIFEQLYEAANAMAEDKPLSNGMLFNLWAAVNFPVHDGLSAAWADTKKYGLGVGVGKLTIRTPLFKHLTDIEKRVITELAPKGMSIAEGRRFLQDEAGGPERFDALLQHYTRAIVADTEVMPGLLGQPVTTAGFAGMAEVNNRVLDAVSRSHIEQGRIDGRTLVEKMRSSFEGPRSTHTDKETGRTAPKAGEVYRSFEPREFMRQWKEWTDRMEALALKAGFQKGGNVVIGVMDSLLPKEHLLAAKAILHNIANADGTIPKHRMDDFLDLFPALTTRGNDPSSFFSRLKAPDSHEVNVGAAVQRIDALLKDPQTMTMREYLWGVEQAQKRAEGLKTNRGTVLNEKGQVDPSRAPDIGNAAVLTPTLKDALRGQMGLDGQKYSDVLASRGNGATRAIEDDLAAVINDSGFNVGAATQGVMSSKGKRATAVALHMDVGTDPGSLQLAAAISLRRTGAKASTILVSGPEALAQHGLTRNAAHVRIDIGRMAEGETDAVLSRVTEAFDGQYELNDTAGVLHVFVKDGQEAAIQDLTDAIESVVGGDRLNVSTAPAWVQVVSNDLRKGTRGRAAAGTVSARDIFAAATGDLRLVNSERKFSQRSIRALEYQTAGSKAATEQRGVLGESRPGVTRGPEFSRTGEHDLGADQGVTYTHQAQVKRPDGLWYSMGSYATKAEADARIASVAHHGGYRVVGTRGFVDRMTENAAASGPDPFTAAHDASGSQGQVVYLAERDAAYENMTPRLTADMAGDASTLGGIDPEQLAKIKDMEIEMRQYDPTYRLKLAPKDAGTYYAGQGNVIKDLTLAAQGSSDLLYQKVWKPGASLWHAITGPVKTTALARDAKQALYGVMLGKTAHLAADKTIRVKDIDSFLQTLDGIAQTHRGPLGARMYTRGDTVNIKTMAEVADGTYARIHGGGNIFPGFSKDALAALGGARNIHKLLDQTGSRFFRDLEKRTAGKGQMGKLISETYGGVRSKTALPRHYIRTYYHFFRFAMDPRFHVMNHAESDILGAVKYGVEATRFGGARSGVIDNATYHMTGRVKEGAKLEDRLGERAIDPMASGYMDARHLEGYIGRAAATGRRVDAREALRTMAQEDPAIGVLRDKFGGTEDEWVNGLEEMMWGFDNKGVEKTYVDEVQNILDEKDRVAMEPLLARLYDRAGVTWRDAKATFAGNTNRSNLERIMNSYFLFWPVSYQIKATKWLFDVLTKQSFGKKTNLGGAWYLNHLYEQHVERLAHDEQYQRMFVDNPALWFTAAMLLPVTPFDDGMSLSRSTKMVLSSVGVIGKDKDFAEDPFLAALKLAHIGPVFTYDLATQLVRESKDKPRKLEVPVT